MERNKKIVFFLALALLWTTAITVACLVDMSDVPAANVENIDKLAHLGFYAIFSILWFLYLENKIESTPKLFLIVFMLSVIFGVFIEFCQSTFTANRQADVNDAIANTIGATIGLLLMAIYTKKFKK